MLIRLSVLMPLVTLASLLPFQALGSACIEALHGLTPEAEAFCRELSPVFCQNQRQIARETRCDVCPDSTQIWKERAAHSSGSCFQEMARYYCENSDWKDLELIQRFWKVREFVDGLPEFKNIEKKVLPALIPCIIARETANFEPLTLTCLGKGQSALGMGQVTVQTLCDALLGYPAGCDCNEKSGVCDRPISDQACESSWIAPYNCPNQQRWPNGVSPRDIHSKILPRDPRFQVRAMAAVLNQKAGLVKGASAGRDYVQSMLKRYRGSLDDGINTEYAGAIMGCYDCLNRKHVPSIYQCLEKATHGGRITRGPVCR